MPIARRGLNYDGSCAHFTVGRHEVPFISFSYGDNVKAEWVYRAGSQMPEADTPGQYEPEEGSLKLSAVNARLFLPLLAAWGAANTRRVAVVHFTEPDIGDDSDLLSGFRIMGAKQSVEAGAKGLEVEMKVRYRMVQWTEKRRCFGNPNGAGTIGQVRI